MSHQDPPPSPRRPYHHWTDHTELCQQGLPDTVDALPVITTFTQEPRKKLTSCILCWQTREFRIMVPWLNPWLCETLQEQCLFWKIHGTEIKQSCKVTAPSPHSPCLFQTFCVSKGINIFNFLRYHGASSTLREVTGDRFMLILPSCTCEFQIYQKSIQVFITARSSWLCSIHKCTLPCTYIFFFLNRFSTWGQMGWIFAAHSFKWL